jgi:hypothetical protein
MAVVTLKYVKDKEAIRRNLRYITHRRSIDGKTITRTLFNDVGETNKQEFYRQINQAGRGAVFFKFVISPDPRREDTNKDLDLSLITRRTIRTLEKELRRRLCFAAAIHPDHRPHRHVHGIFIVRGRLSKEHFRALAEVARTEATRQARLQRKALDLTLGNPRYQRITRSLRPLLPRRGGARVPKVQPGCRACGFGESAGIPAYKTHCPICRVSLSDNRQVSFRLHPREGRWP